MTAQFVTLDLAEIREDLGAHYQVTEQDNYKGVCPECGEDVPQTVSECEICGSPVIWLRSKLWKRLFGSPQAMMRRLSSIEPEEETGRQLCRAAGVPGFANKTEAKRWGIAARKLGQARMMGIVRWAGEKQRGRGVIARGLNLAEKVVREEAIPKPIPRPVVEGSEQKEIIY